MPGTSPSSTYPYQHIYERDDFTCRFCGWNGKDGFSHWWVANFSVVQIKPSIHGGVHDDDNLVLSCHACAQHKGDADCNSLDEAQGLVAANRAHAEAWFKKHVLKEGG